MRYRSRERSCGRRHARPPLGMGHRILTVTDGGLESPLVTTRAAHGLAGGEELVLSGTSGAAYDGTVFALTDPAPTATTFGLSGVYSADAAGGTWRRP